MMIKAEYVWYRYFFEVTIRKMKVLRFLLRKKNLPVLLFLMISTFPLWLVCSQQPMYGGIGTSTEVVGCIRTPDEKAVDGLPVKLYRYNNGVQWFTKTEVEYTNSKGEFSFRDIDTGSYLLEVRDTNGRCLMEEVILDYDHRNIPLGTLYIDFMGSVKGYVLDNTDATIDANTRIWLYKGNIPVCALWVRDAFTIDSLPPGTFGMQILGQIMRHDDIYRSSDTITIMDSAITIAPKTSAIIDTVFINEAVIRTGDSTIISEINVLKDFLLKSGCKPDISAGWFHPMTRHIRIIEAKSTNKMSLDTAIQILSVFSGIEKIHLSGFSGTVVPTILFNDKELTELSLTDGEISEVPEQIRELKRLKILRLNNNKIRKIPDFLLDRSLPVLQKVDFTGNPLSSIEWQQQENINSLILDGVQIILSGKVLTINEREYRALLSFFKSNGLSGRLIHPYIATGTQIDEQDAVVSLSINDAIISELPSDFVDLVNLHSLYIARNSLDIVPEVFGKLAKLEHLHITNGTIRSLPLQLGQCTKLKTIDFTNNKITRLPKWLGILRSLEYADFSNNCIDTVNTTVPFNCIVNNLECNAISSAPDSLFIRDTVLVSTIVNYGHKRDSLPLMDFFQCRSNRVVLLRIVIDNEIRMRAFDSLCTIAAQLDSLKTLHIVMRNNAETVPELSVVFPCLEEFIGGGGGLRFLPVSFKVSFPSLKKIALPGNRFEDVPDVLLSYTSLSAVDMYFNRLTKLTEEDSLWLDKLSIPDRRVLWDKSFGFSYIHGINWRDSQLDHDTSSETIDQ